MDKSKTIEILNSLVIINNDRIEGYETASQKTDEFDLKNMFTQFAQTSHKCKRELLEEIISLGGSMAEGTKTTGKFFRAWMNVKAALTGRDRKVILKSCKYGEEKALEAYKEALRDESDSLDPQQELIIEAQYSDIKNDYDRIKSMSTTLEEA